MSDENWLTVELDPEMRWCIFCGADCWIPDDDQDHNPSCPAETGIWPDDRGDTICTACHDWVGDHYGLLDANTGRPAVRAAIGEVVCLPCHVLAGVTT